MAEIEYFVIWKRFQIQIHHSSLQNHVSPTLFPDPRPRFTASKSANGTAL
jgi:hypothetical protein